MFMQLLLYTKLSRYNKVTDELALLSMRIFRLALQLVRPVKGLISPIRIFFPFLPHWHLAE
jgi:hypothetical protein